MATILLNGAEFDASKISEKNDKLTVSGGTDALDVNLLGGDDLIEVATQGENITSSKMDGGAGDDVITIELNGEDDDFTATSTISANSTIRGAAGNDTININDGNVIVEGLVNANAGADTINVVRADGATIQGGADGDVINLGSIASLDQSGSQATNGIKDTTIFGGQGSDTIRVQESADLTAGSTDGAGTGILNGGDHGDTIIIEAGASIENYAVNGNKGDDVISTGDNAFTNTTILGGMGKDLLQVGGGVTAVGGKGADTFSIVSAGGVTIEDFDQDAPDCFCSDAIRVDGDKINYDSEDYKFNVVDFTSESSWKGNIKVKAVSEPTACNTATKITFQGTKTETLNATAVIAYKISKDADTALDGSNFAVSKKSTWAPAVKYPNQGFRPTANGGKETGINNGNDPRKTGLVENIGFGFASVTGYWTKQGEVTAGGRNLNQGAIRSALAYTRATFQKGDFSFLSKTKQGKATCTLSQTLKFNDVSNATITNHHRSYIVSKETNEKALYDLKLGTANFSGRITGKANLLISGIADQTFVPTANQLQGTGNAANFITADGGFKRTNKAATENAQITLDLDGTFDLWTKAKAEDPWVKHSNTKWSQMGVNGRRTLSVATSIFGPDGPVTQFIPTQFKQQQFKQAAAQTKVLATNYSNPVSITTRYIGGSQAVRDTAIAKGQLFAKIAVTETISAAENAALDRWISRAIIPGQEFDVTKCTFPATIKGNRTETNNRLNKSGLVKPTADDAFEQRYLWTTVDRGTVGRLGGQTTMAGGAIVDRPAAVSLNMSSKIAALPASSATCDTTAFSCSFNSSAGSAQQLINNLKNGAGANNNFFFSGSEFNTAVLDDAGFGDNLNVNQQDVQGAPFRVLFFDTKGTDNGLYVMSGTAEYKDGALTGINTNPTRFDSMMGGKETIVKVTGGKAADFSLSDINFV